MAPFFNRMEIQKGRCGKMSQDSGKGLRPRQYGGTNQLAEDRLERKAPMSRGLRQGGKQIISADSLLKKGEESLQRGPSSLAGRCMISAAGRSGQFAGVCGKGVCIYAEVVRVCGATFAYTLR